MTAICVPVPVPLEVKEPVAAKVGAVVKTILEVFDAPVNVPVRPVPRKSEVDPAERLPREAKVS